MEESSAADAMAVMHVASSSFRFLSNTMFFLVRFLEYALFLFLFAQYLASTRVTVFETPI